MWSGYMKPLTINIKKSIYKFENKNKKIFKDFLSKSNLVNDIEEKLYEWFVSAIQWFCFDSSLPKFAFLIDLLEKFQQNLICDSN